MPEKISLRFEKYFEQAIQDITRKETVTIKTKRKTKGLKLQHISKSNLHDKQSNSLFSQNLIPTLNDMPAPEQNLKASFLPCFSPEKIKNSRLLKRPAAILIEKEAYPSLIKLESQCKRISIDTDRSLSQPFDQYQELTKRIE